MFNHPPFSLKNYSCVLKKLQKMCKNSQRISLESGKHAATGKYNAKRHSTSGHEIVVSCTGWLKNQHTMSSQPPYSSLMVCCRVGLMFVYLLSGMFGLLHYKLQ